MTLLVAKLRKVANKLYKQLNMLNKFVKQVDMQGTRFKGLERCRGFYFRRWSIKGFCELVMGNLSSMSNPNQLTSIDSQTGGTWLGRTSYSQSMFARWL